jgi:hypothetical protein
MRTSRVAHILMAGPRVPGLQVSVHTKELRGAVNTSMGGDQRYHQ